MVFGLGSTHSVRTCSPKKSEFLERAIIRLVRCGEKLNPRARMQFCQVIRVANFRIHPRIFILSQ